MVRIAACGSPRSAPRCFPLLLASLLGAGVPLTASAQDAGKSGGQATGHRVPLYKKSFFSQPYTVDRIYKSMQGPQGLQRIRLRKGEPELLWIRAYRTEIVGPDSAEPVAPDYMCHNNLNIEDLDRHHRLFGSQATSQPRLFTLSQGQMDVAFPKGFGIPILSDESLLVATQVLNHNEKDANFQVRHRTTIEYVRDRDLKTPMKGALPAGGRRPRSSRGRERPPEPRRGRRGAR